MFYLALIEHLNTRYAETVCYWNCCEKCEQEDLVRLSASYVAYFQGHGVSIRRKLTQSFTSNEQGCAVLKIEVRQLCEAEWNQARILRVIYSKRSETSPVFVLFVVTRQYTPEKINRHILDEKFMCSQWGYESVQIY